jgi:CheY-like chemotaxis protein
VKDTPLHILLADDDENDRFLFKEAMSKLTIPLEIHTVNNGDQLMSYLTRADAVLPDLLFLDLNMPRKNGMQCLKEIRSNPIWKDISIAIYSTSSSEKDIEDTFIYGANVYIQKPNEFGMLKQALEKAITTTYHYHDQPFNRENFMLRL